MVGTRVVAHVRHYVRIRRGDGTLERNQDISQSFRHFFARKVMFVKSALKFPLKSR
jgi:hypothetical protein